MFLHLFARRGAVYLGFHFASPFYRMNRTTLLCALSLIALSACSFGGTPSDQNSSVSSEAVSSSDVQETRNVSYQGTVEKQGVSIFMEGTHRLRLADGRFILMESEVVDLGTYIGQKAEVFGAVRPTVEQGGLIMRVERVTSLEVSSSSSSVGDLIFCGGIAGLACPDGMQCVDDPDDSCDPENGGADCGGICTGTPTSSVSSVSSSSVSSVASVTSVTSSVASVASSVAAAPVSSSTSEQPRSA